MAYVGEIMIHEPDSNLKEILSLMEYLSKQVDSSYKRIYDREGFHEGPRKGKYFKPGEREAGGPEVKVVQAPEAKEDKQAKFDEVRVKTENFVQGLLDPNSGTGFFGDFKTKEVKSPWEAEFQGMPAIMKSTWISEKQLNMLQNKLTTLNNIKNRKKVGLENIMHGKGMSWRGDFFGGSENRIYTVQLLKNGAGILRVTDNDRAEKIKKEGVQEEEQVKEQAKADDPLTDYFGGETYKEVQNSVLSELMQGGVPSLERIGAAIKAKQTKPIPEKLADELGDLKQYLDIEKSVGENTIINIIDSYLG